MTVAARRPAATARAYSFPAVREIPPVLRPGQVRLDLVISRVLRREVR